MTELTITEVFLVLKPLCDSFMNEPTLQKTEDILTLIHRTPNMIIQKFYDNILYPFIHHLKNNTLGIDKNVKLIEIIKIIIMKVKIENIKLFYEIYHCLRKQICQQNNTMELIETHEELKEIVVLCLRDLILNSSVHIIELFYTRENAALLSHGIYLCIKIARLEKSNSLRIAAINAVMSLLQVHEEADVQDVVLRNQISNVIMLFLPGVASGLLEVALGSDIQNHKITLIAIRAWSRAIAFIMQDIPEEENNVSSLMIENIVTVKNPGELEKLKHILKNTKRTSEWYLAVSEKFKILFQELDNLSKHSHYKVRKELADGSSHLLLNCSRNMTPCFQILLEILITLSEDENTQVAETSKQALKNIQNKCFQDKSMKSTVEVIEENLYGLLTKMPRIIRTSGESLQLVWLNRLAGYLTILGKQRVSKIFLSTAHLRKLILTLVYIAELDISDISSLEHSTITNFEEALHYKVTNSQKQFKFLFDSASVKKLYSIFRILGEFGDRKTIVDAILNMTLDIPKFKKELTLLLNVILEVPADTTIQMLIFDQVIEHYTVSHYWNLPVQISDEVTLQIAQNNILQCCLLLEGLGVIAQVLQENFQYFLLRTLYLVIERAGSEQNLLRFTGLSTLEIIASSQKLNSVGQLFQCNFDYISYHVTLKLRRIERNPGVLNVIAVIMNYSTMDFLTHLKDIVDDMLIESSSSVQKCNGRLFLKVFYSFIICVKKLASTNNFEINKDSNQELKSIDIAETIINDFLEFYRVKNNSNFFEEDENHETLAKDFDENFLHNSNNNTDIEENIFETDKKEDKAPYFVSMITSIMKRCLHFLPSQNINEVSLAMSILKEGCIILKDWENELLPVIHELWHPLVDRFHDSNPLIINQAWQLLCCLAEVSQDFIRSRTLKQILPALSVYLKKSSKESYKKDSSSSYKYTQLFKLQKEVLIQLGKIVKNLKLLERDLWNLLEVIEPYLDCLQNKQLQEYCIKAYEDISEFDEDIVWIKCIDIWNRQVEPVLDERDFTSWYLKIINSSIKSNYQENVQTILTYIYKKRQIL